MVVRDLIYGCSGACVQCGAPAEVDTPAGLLCPVHLGHVCGRCGGEMQTDGHCDGEACRCADCGARLADDDLLLCEDCRRWLVQDANGWLVEVRS